MKSVTALAPWFGSNRMLASEVGKRLEGCSWVGIPFAGGMCEVAHIKARTLAINDLHRHMIALARTAAHPLYGPKLLRKLRRLAYHPDTLAGAQSRCLSRDGIGYQLNGDDLLQWAEDYFVCAWMGRHGVAGTDGEFRGKLAIRWNAAGGDNVKHLRGATESLRDWRRILARATFTCLDAFDFLAKCKDAEGHGIYCDPPFPGPGDGYTHKFSVAEHRKLADVLGRYEKTRIVCRYYDVPLIRELYPESRWEWNLLQGRKQTNAAAPEVLIVSRDRK